MRLNVLSRGSALARLQAALVSRALSRAHPGLVVECHTRASAGDRDQATPLWQLGDRGAFTADLSHALLHGEADVVVHSFKDLPIELPPGTTVAGALPRADPRDLLLIRRRIVGAAPAEIRILSSSPRRAFLLQETLPSLLPWPVRAVHTQPVRGNIETRLRKLVEGDAHGLVMAKAALDRLLTFGPPFEREAATVRGYLDQCHWMVLPMREFPWAPAQGALALEIREGRDDLQALLEEIVCRATTNAVTAERQLLAAQGGGCHQALGAAIIDTPYGRVVSIRARGPADEHECRWELAAPRAEFPRASAERVWPAPGEEINATRNPLPAQRPGPDVGLRVTRAEALPSGWAPTPDTAVWAAGGQTWRKLAAQGIWVHGCADGLGDEERPPVDALAGRDVTWVRLTHAAGANTADAVATYSVTPELPEDLPSRSHFFWTSGTVFTTALARWPALDRGWHGSGPGRTHQVIAAALGDAGRTGVWLDRASWERDICLS
ncbi:MAG: hydroxymethylbilane synthase [Acidobacteriota bacterium]|nr:hydroxymethylbilane synthase [Acidobacteriota bacterium]